MTQPRVERRALNRPTVEQCNANQEVAPGIFAGWYPLPIGGSAQPCLIDAHDHGDLLCGSITDPGDSSFDVTIWHDGSFGLTDHDHLYSRQTNVATLSHSTALQFIEFGELVQRLQTRPRVGGEGKVLKHPTVEQCEANVEVAPGVFVGWYAPQMGGYVSRSLIDLNHLDGRFDITIFHDGEFPLHEERTADAPSFTGCDPQKFIDFGELIERLQTQTHVR